MSIELNVILLGFLLKFHLNSTKLPGEERNEALILPPYSGWDGICSHGCGVSRLK